MQINLGTDTCTMYEEWQAYIKLHSDLSIIDLSNIDKTEESYAAKCMNPTARNRWRFAAKHYTSAILDRNVYLDSIYAINTSADKRQGKPMREAYQQYPVPSDYTVRCTSHYALFFGCYANGKPDTLYAYITAQICGDMLAVTQIIGHADYLKDGVMLNVFAKVAEYALQNNLKVILYSRWKDGTDGLRHWKYSVGFKPGILTNSCV